MAANKINSQSPNRKHDLVPKNILIGMLACRPTDNALIVVGEVSAICNAGLFLKYQRKEAPITVHRLVSWEEMMGNDYKSGLRFVTKVDAGKWETEIWRKWELKQQQRQVVK